MLRQACEAFLRRMAIAHASRFSPSAFFDAMEPVFRRDGFRAMSEGAEPERILVLRLDAAGDMVLTSGFLRELRRNYPGASIALVTGPAAASLVEFCPYVEETLSFDQGEFFLSLENYLGKALDFCEAHLWRQKFSLCVCPQWGDDKRASMLLAYLSGAEQRVFYSAATTQVYVPDGRADQSFEFALATDTYASPPEIIHEADRCLHLLRLMGKQVEDSSMEVWVGEEDISRARFLLGDMAGRFPAALGLGAGAANRKYPPSQYLEAMQAIAEKHPEVRFVLLGGKDERQDGKFLVERMPRGTVVNLAGAASLRESVAALSLAELYLGNVTGLMHAAAAIGLPVIALYREPADCSGRIPGIFSERHRFAPWDANAIILQPEHALDDCAKKLVYGGCQAMEPHCITQIRPEDIVEAFEILARAICSHANEVES